jgi:hypothetical protein
MWRHLGRYMCSDVSEEPAAFTIRVNVCSVLYVPQNFSHAFFTVHGVTFCVKLVHFRILYFIYFKFFLCFALFSLSHCMFVLIPFIYLPLPLLSKTGQSM